MKHLFLTLIAMLTFSFAFSQGGIIRYVPVIVEGDTLYKRVEEDISSEEKQEPTPVATPDLGEMLNSYRYWQGRKARVASTLMIIEDAENQQFSAIREASDTFPTYPEYNRYADTTWAEGDTSLVVLGSSGRYSAKFIENAGGITVMRLIDSEGALVDLYPVVFLYEDKIIRIGNNVKILPSQNGPLELYYNEPRDDLSRRREGRGIRIYSNYTSSGKVTIIWRTANR